MERQITVYIVVPCYNEEAVLPEAAERLCGIVRAQLEAGALTPMSRVLFVDDGSRDGTWEAIRAAMRAHPEVEGLRLAHNAGHQNALWAGMMTARGKADAVITIDADMQDDPGVIADFLDAYRNEGCELVYGVRSSRAKDSAFKRLTARGFYRLMDKMGAETVYDHADYRLIGSRALDALSRFGEVNLFLRGMVPLLGFKSKKVPYARGERLAGESKYPLKKMLSFALEGITSFSVKPIRCVVLLGALFMLLGVVMALYALFSLIAGRAVAGWTSIMVSIWVIGGVQLLALGLIGEYVGKIYTEVKHRPRYIVDEYLTKDGGADGRHT